MPSRPRSRGFRCRTPGIGDRPFRSNRAFWQKIRYDPPVEASGVKVVPNKGQLQIWGRANSVNVQKVLWCLRELDLAYERIDAGMAFGRNREPDYLAMNPNGRIPTLADGDFVLWESNSIMRYLVIAYAPQSPLYPQAPSSTLNWRRDASSRARSLPSPILRSAPMPDAGLALKASASRRCRTSNAGSHNLQAGPDSSNSSRRQCRERRSLRGPRSKTRPLDQQNANDHRKRDGGYRQARRPTHAPAHPPEQRATHQDGNDDIEWQWACPVAALGV